MLWGLLGAVAKLRKNIWWFTDIYYFWLHGTVFNYNRSLQNLKDFQTDNNEMEEEKKN
jgi:hypothetical protein